MWQIVKNSNQWCVEDASGNISQCFGTREAAAKHRDALMVAEVRKSNELTHIASSGQPVRLFNEYTFGEPPDWMPCLPRPGTFQHPSYGEIAITPERNENFVRNFKAGIYQKRLPVDAEHQTKLSGACGWIVDMRLNEDGSADAQVEWTDRGKSLIESDRFRYVSPEWYDEWEQPDTAEEYADVIIGAAITNRPFFKESALRPLVASENGLYISNEETNPETTIVFFEQFKELIMSQPSSSDVHEDTIMQKKRTNDNQTEIDRLLVGEEKEEDQFMEDDAMDDEDDEEEEESKTASEQRSSKRLRTFAEAKRRLAAAEERASEAEERANQFAEALDKTNARIAAMEADARRKRFAETSNGWLGKPEDNVAILESMAETFGEDSEQFKRYVTQQSNVASQMRESAIFEEFGSDANEGAGKSAWDRIEIAAQKLMSEQSSLTYNQAIEQASKQNPKLYREYQDEMRNR